MVTSTVIWFLYGFYSDPLPFSSDLFLAPCTDPTRSLCRSTPAHRPKLAHVYTYTFKQNNTDQHMYPSAPPDQHVRALVLCLCEGRLEPVRRLHRLGVIYIYIYIYIYISSVRDGWNLFDRLPVSVEECCACVVW
jgi:hypothetical protein